MKRFAQFLVAAASVLLLVPAVAATRRRGCTSDSTTIQFPRGTTAPEMLDSGEGRERDDRAHARRPGRTSPPPARRTPPNPFDPAYKLNDLDELVRNAQARDMEVLLTIWGTPKWANGGKTPNFLPEKLADLTNFSRALAARYSGRFAGFPFVALLLRLERVEPAALPGAPVRRQGQVGRPAPLREARRRRLHRDQEGELARASSAIGETSSHGRDKMIKGKTDTHSPGRFAQLVAAANPRLKFDAWAQHPYPFPVRPEADPEGALPERDPHVVPAVREGSGQVVQAQERPALDHRVRPRGQGRRRAAGRLRARRRPRTLGQALRSRRRTRASTCSSGSSSATTPRASGRAGSRRSPAPRSRRSRRSDVPGEERVDIRNPIVTVKAGKINPVVTVPLRQYGAGSQAGETVGFTINVVEKGRLVAESQPQSVVR